MDSLISTPHLLAIKLALSGHRPELSVVIDKVLAADPVELDPLMPGEPVGDKYAITVSIEEQKKVTEALEEIRVAMGDSTLFGSSQINLLWKVWTEACASS